jgi:hypothetical protein
MVIKIRRERGSGKESKKENRNKGRKKRKDFRSQLYGKDLALNNLDFTEKVRFEVRLKESEWMGKANVLYKIVY